MISDQIIEFEYPSLEQWEDVTKYFTDHVLLWWAIKSNFVDDEMVLLFRNIVLQNFKVYYQERGIIVTGKQIGRASCRERVSSPV